ncbi:hypothetical protein GCM10010517_42570 [Streptosporangium fragile]|uniref:Uncharacterized protein n=1 Tax=Streptosporangium fragile TaxID=46186 RepID=A0ABN3W0P6_9ACTN
MDLPTPDGPDRTVRRLPAVSPAKADAFSGPAAEDEERPDPLSAVACGARLSSDHDVPVTPNPP